MARLKTVPDIGKASVKIDADIIGGAYGDMVEVRVSDGGATIKPVTMTSKGISADTANK